MFIRTEPQNALHGSLIIQDNLISLLHNKNQTNLFHVMYGLANIDISSLMNLSQKLISISHRLFRTVSYNNKPKQRHWLEGKSDAVSVISKDSLPTLNANKTLHDFFMTGRWNEKALCSNYTKACIFTSPIFTRRTKTGDCWRGLCLLQTKGDAN